MSAFDGLIAAMASAASLPLAACRGRHDLFDPPADGVARNDPAEHDPPPPSGRGVPRLP